MKNIEKHIIHKKHSVRQVLSKLDILASDAILFLVNDDFELIGSITDGDIRRGLIKGLGLEDEIIKFSQAHPKFFRKNQFDLKQMQEWREKNYKIIPVLDSKNKIIDIINFRLQKSYLPIDAVIMAGGKGTRLRPLTLDTPKPLLKVGGKAIIEYNVDRLNAFGVHYLTISINYLGDQLIAHFKDGKEKGMNINYIEEDQPLGTIGAVRRIEQFHHDYILVMNSDLLTDINYEDLFEKLLSLEGDMIIATTPYEVKIPYGVIETKGEQITKLTEKPTYRYYSNAGIYLIRKELVQMIPKNAPYDAPNLMEAAIKMGKKVLHYPILGYWLDIGKPQDFEKAQEDIKRLNFL